MTEPHPALKSVIVVSGTGAAGIKQVNINVTGPTGYGLVPSWLQATGGYPGNMPTVQATNSYVPGLENVSISNYNAVAGITQSPAYQFVGAMANINMASNSNPANYSAFPSQTNIGGITQGYTGPDGQTGAWHMAATTGAGDHLITNSLTRSANAQPLYTYSLIAKAAEYSRVYLMLAQGNNFGTGNVLACYDLAGGQVAYGPTLASGTGFVLAGASAGIAPVGNGWYLCQMTASWPAISNAFFAIGIDGNTGLAAPRINYSGPNNTAGVILWNSNLLPAAATGLTTQSFADNFASLANIDVNNTLAPGYNWYIQAGWTNSTLYTQLNGSPTTDVWRNPTGITAGSIGMSGGYVTLANDASAYGYTIATAAQSGSSYVGTAWSGPRLMIASLNYNVALAVSGTTSWPAFWAMDLDFLLGSTANFNEIDMWEAIPTGTGTISSNWNEHAWNISAGNLTQAEDSFSTNPAGVTGPTGTFAKLFIPGSANGGTGMFQSYFNGNLLHEFVYAAGTTFASGENNPAPLIIGAGPNWPVGVNYVGVWT